MDRVGSTASVDAVASRLAAAVAETRARWPEVGACDELFVEALIPRVDGEPDLDDALARLALPDIYLVAACLAGDRGGLVAFDKLLRAETSRAVARLGTQVSPDDVVQELHVKLLVPNAAGAAKLAAFGGHGALHAWLRVSAVRTAISLGRKTRDSAGSDEEALDAIADDGDDQALAFLKTSYREQFKRAFAAGFAALPPRSRTLLRLQILDQLTFEEIAAFYRVSRATAARWLADARTSLVEATQKELSSALGMPAAELAEMMRMVASNLYSTLPGLLRRTGS